VRTRRILLMLIALFSLGTRIGAHPTATSFVIIGVGATEVEVALTTDEHALQLKLQALSSSIEELISLRLDDRVVPLQRRDTERVADRPGHVRIAFVAELPKGAATLQWRTSLFLGSYPLAVQSGHALTAPENDRHYEWINGTESSRIYQLDALGSDTSRWPEFGRLVTLGFTHILPGGLDHVLFVLGLTMLAASVRTLVLQISLFTIAHSATLGLALAGVVAVPGRVVEPLIAVSIAYVAIENLRTRSLSYWRLVLVLGFGLLHGLGFAGALRDTGLAGSSLATTLVGFNLGVELGQLTVVVAALVFLRLLPLRDTQQDRFVLRPASAAIAAIGIFWAVQRTFAN
jgi:hypothetical protein